MLKRRLLGNAVVNLPKGKEVMSDNELRDELQKANRLKLDITELLHKCGAAMTTALAKQGKAH